MIGYIFLLLLLTTHFHHTEAKGLINRCLLKRKEHIYLNCPDNHVIYQPEVFLGISQESECKHQNDDCVGLSHTLMKQKNKCHWSASCSFGWRLGDVILKSKAIRCIGKYADYVSYSNPRCINKDHVFSICQQVTIPTNVNSGVIRSHEEYPWAYGTIIDECIQRIEIGRGILLALTIDDLETQSGDHLIIKHKHGTITNVVFNGTYSQGQAFKLHFGLLEIHFMASMGAKIGRGFVIRFERKKLNLLSDSLQSFVKNKPPVKKVQYAVIEECVNRKNDLIHLTCPADHVIYKPNLEVGSSNFNLCYGSHGDCKGKIHTILTQEISCYWRNNCDVTWNGEIPITMTSSPYCLASMPSYITMSKFQCIQKDSIFDICDKSIWEITQPEGLIRSHAMYPWDFKAAKNTCRKRIRINRKSGLRIYTDDFDLDLDTRGERVNIWHVSPTGVRTKRNKLRGQSSTEIVEMDGCIDIEFKMSNESKSGRGFIFRFENYLNVDGDSDDNLWECGGKATYFPKKTKRGKKRNKKGKRRNIKKRRRIRIKGRRKNKNNKRRRVSSKHPNIVG